MRHSFTTTTKTTFIIQLTAVFFLLLPASIFAQISGRIFKDFNANGTFDSGNSYKEVGQSGVIVNAYSPTGALTVSYTGGGNVTNNTGEYAVSGGTIGQIRLEFILPDNYTFATNGLQGGSTVMFPTAATQNLAVYYPIEFNNQSNPYIAVPHFINGTYNNTTSSPYPSLFSFPYKNSGNVTGGFNLYQPDTIPNTKAIIGQLGATWGTAYQRATKTLYSSAVLRRFCGFGPLGTGGIYKTDMSNPSSNTGASAFIDVTQIGIPTGIDPRTANSCNSLATAVDAPAHDTAAANLVGKIGIGGIEYDEARNTLWLINLNDRKLYGIQNLNPSVTPTASDVIGGFTVTLPNGYTVTDGVLRPWAIKVYKGFLYIGAVADGSANINPYDINNLKGYVLKFDPNNPTVGFSVEYDFSFDYVKAGYGQYVGQWLCWLTAGYNTGTYWNDQPILSDIEFDVDGSLILGILSRGGLQNGSLNNNQIACNVQLEETPASGDLLRACKTATGYVLSGNAGCTTTIPSNVIVDGDNDPAPPNSYVYEYYWGEHGPTDSNDAFNESALGALAFLPGSGQVMTTAMDPENFHSGGVITLDNTTGGDVERYNLYYSQQNGVTTATMAKAIGLGDIEVISNTPSMEIGNRVFMDSNSNGIQDAGEMGIAGVTVLLKKLVAGNYVDVASCVTDADGNYYFSSAAGTSVAGITYNCSDLTPNAQFKLYVPITLQGKTLTLKDADNSSNGNNRDSDADEFGVIGFSTGNIGENNHSFDIGYKIVNPINSCSVAPSGPSANSCSTLPRLMATPIYVNGNSLANGTSATQNGLAIFNETNFGENTPPQKNINSSQIGSVWGVAYKEQNNTLYTSAFLKRHMGLGPNGTGAIYYTNPTLSAPIATLFIDLSTLGVNTGANPRVPTAGAVDHANELPANTTEPSWDVATFDLVGKLSLGGLDISQDGTKMYVMNLKERELVVLDISTNTPSLIGKYAIPDPGCSNGDFRPWAVKAHQGKVYVGVVCSAETSQLTTDLSATVLEFNGSTFCQIFNIPLNYPRGVAGGAAGQLNDPAEWKPWTNTWQSVSATFNSNGTVIYPQPILSDIEFDMDGSMILAFLDRNGHQTGVLNYKPDISSTETFVGQSAGDLLRVGLINGTYQLENNGQINGVQAQTPDCWNPSNPPLSGKDNQQGPGGGEYYWSDNYAYNPCNTAGTGSGIHQEISFGGLAFVPGSGEIAITGMDPTETANSGGISWFNNSTGKRRIDETSPFDLTKHGYRIYDQNLQGGFGKAAGLGDIEVFCANACNLASTIVPTHVTCKGGNNGAANLSITGANGAVSFIWSNAATTEDLNNIIAGIYAVTIADAICSVTNSVTITAPSTAINAGTDQLLVCSGSVAPTIAALGAAPNGQNWYVVNQPNGANALVNSTGNVTNLTVAGDYIFELRSDIDSTCKDDVKVTIPTCIVPCPNPNCATLSVKKM
jgi:hypothetical protein